MQRYRMTIPVWTRRHTFSDAWMLHVATCTTDSDGIHPDMDSRVTRVHVYWNSSVHVCSRLSYACTRVRTYSTREHYCRVTRERSKRGRTRVPATGTIFTCQILFFQNTRYLPRVLVCIAIGIVAMAACYQVLILQYCNSSY